MSSGTSLEVGMEKLATPQDMLANTLVNASKALLKKGLDRDYQEHVDDLSCPRGKISVTNTLKRNLFIQRKLSCHYDELSTNILQNQIIKATLSAISKTKDILPKLRDEAKAVERRFPGVSQITISATDFRKVKLHRNNTHYGLVMQLCEMLHSCLFPVEGGKGYKFLDILNNEEQMGLIFQSFVRNFYTHEQSRYSVKSEDIAWQAKATPDHLTFLPKMSTDISLTSPNKKIIIDTKFYKETLHTNWGSKKVRSDHLYQLYAYLSNYQDNTKATEGILLYPTIDTSYNLDYEINGYKMMIRTINLNQGWQGIRSDLLGVVN